MVELRNDQSLPSIMSQDKLLPLLHSGERKFLNIADSWGPNSFLGISFAIEIPLALLKRNLPWSLTVGPIACRGNSLRLETQYPDTVNLFRGHQKHSHNNRKFWGTSKYILSFWFIEKYPLHLTGHLTLCNKNVSHTFYSDQGFTHTINADFHSLGQDRPPPGLLGVMHIVQGPLQSPSALVHTSTPRGRGSPVQRTRRKKSCSLNQQTLAALLEARPVMHMIPQRTGLCFLTTRNRVRVWEVTNLFKNIKYSPLPIST